MKKILKIAFLITSLIILKNTYSQEKSLVNTYNSHYAKLWSIDMGDIKWTGGFWKYWFDICKDTMIIHKWKILSDPTVAHAFKNFEIAAGLDTGNHAGPPFHDGDFYKWFEAVAAIYAITKDNALDKLMDSVIRVIALAQRSDGYIHTPVLIKQKNHKFENKEFGNKLHFETYNFGHLITAACIHYRATGKKSFLEIAEKAAKFLKNYAKQHGEELAQSTICPSHYMAIIELYRTTKNKEYLDLANLLLNIRNLVKNGTDDNQDRIPLKQHRKIVGHAVRANYLYAGVADIYTENGDDSLWSTLDAVWNDLIKTKIYITGGCGALYNGVSPDGTTYDQSVVQHVHQAYGREYQLPNITAHNETCAAIGNILWNWRMFLITGEAKYIDYLELSLYNSVLSGVSLDGIRYFYTNPLCVVNNLPYKLRWSKEREEYIKICNCCPPNTIRTIAESYNYAYALSNNGLWVNIYGTNKLSTNLGNGRKVILRQETNYPWEGKITLIIDTIPSKNFSIHLRIPEWCSYAKIKYNNRKYKTIKHNTKSTYVEINKEWKSGDIITLILKIKVIKLIAHPFVEESKNQLAIKRGPIIYCLESPDIKSNTSILQYSIKSTTRFKAFKSKIEKHEYIALKGKAIVKENFPYDKLYSPISKIGRVEKITLIPYYAWQNRGKSEMTVWLPLYK